MDFDGGAGRFEPPAPRRGDVAQAVFYVAAVYPNRTGAEARTWSASQVKALLAWHEA